MNTITTKSFVTSRINWLGIAIILEALYTFMGQYEGGLVDIPSIIRFTMGALIVIIRTADTYKSINRLV